MYGDGYSDQIVTMLHGAIWVLCLCIPIHVHCSCGSLMTLLCILVLSLFPLLFLQSLYVHFRIFHSLVVLCRINEGNSNYIVN